MSPSILSDIDTLAPSHYPLTPDSQPCPVCAHPIGICAGIKDAICRNCGFKDPCCD